MYKETPVKGSCLQCGSVIYGRSDKKFCDSRCKNAYHNHEAEAQRKYRKHVLAALESNYGLLEDLLKVGQTSIPAEKAAALGFKAKYVTWHRRRCRADEFGCYDIKYNKSDSRIFNIHRAGPDIEQD